MKPLILLILLLFPSLSHAQNRVPLHIARYTFAASTAADFYSGVRLDPRRFHETNLMGQRRPVQIAFMSGSAAVVWHGSGYIWNRGGKKNKILSLSILAAGIAAHTYATAHNWRLR